jgi:hypothetical protein
MMPIVSIAMVAPSIPKYRDHIDCANQVRKSPTVKIKSTASLIHAITADRRAISPCLDG